LLSDGVVDVALLTETWNCRGSVNIPGYIYKAFDRNTINSSKKQGGGLGYYIRDNIICEHLSLNLDCKDVLEGCALTVKKCLILNFYRPPNGDLNKFLAHFSEILTDCKQRFTKYTICVMGDLNIDVSKAGKHAGTDRYISLMESELFESKNFLPTRVAGVTSSIIDHLFIYEMGPLCKKNGVMLTDISDHFTVFLDIEIKQAREKNVPKKSRVLSDLNLENFRKAIELIEMNRNESDINILYDNFTSQLEEAFNKTCPYKKQGREKPEEDWMTKALMKSRRRKFYLLNLKLKHRTEKYENKYKKYVRIYNSTIRAAKRKFYIKKISDNYTNSRLIWNIINELTGRMKRVKQSKFFTHNNSKYSKPGEICKLFNEYFIKIGKEISDKFNKTDEYKRYLKRKSTRFKFTEVTMKRIVNIINKMKSKSSSGHDGISNKILKKIKLEISPKLEYLFKKSLQTGIFPDSLKIARVMPLYKKGSMTDITNYRPISLLPCISKILEKLVNSDLREYFETNNYFTNTQFGFRKGTSTVNAMMENIGFIDNAKVNKELAANVYLDLSKAFDIIPHTFLLTKLENYGIKKEEYKWFESYLSNRKQYVEYMEAKSELKMITIGVPQGSCLGPTLFLIYINDLPNCLKQKIILFADDTSLIATAKTIEELTKQTEEGLTNIAKWLECNALKVNPTKTRLIVFGSKKPMNIQMNGCKIKQVGEGYEEKSHRMLGFHIDDKLNWKEHIRKTKQECIGAIYNLFRAKNYIGVTTKKLIYNALIKSKLEYGICIWGAKNINILETLQKKAVRAIINSKKHYHTNKIFKEHELLKLKDIYVTQCQIEAKKIDLKLNNNQASLLKMARTTRLASKKMAQHEKIGYGKQIRDQIPIHWNKLDVRLKMEPKIHVFKKELKYNYIKNYSTTFYCNNKKCPECTGTP
jgi:hypothetical protein